MRIEESKHNNLGGGGGGIRHAIENDLDTKVLENGHI